LAHNAVCCFTRETSAFVCGRLAKIPNARRVFFCRQSPGRATSSRGRFDEFALTLISSDWLFMSMGGRSGCTEPQQLMVTFWEEASVIRPGVALRLQGLQFHTNTADACDGLTLCARPTFCVFIAHKKFSSRISC